MGKVVKRAAFGQRPSSNVRAFAKLQKCIKWADSLKIGVVEEREMKGNMDSTKGRKKASGR